MIAIFQENVGAEEVMSFDNLLLGKEAELHDLYVAESKFKEAGLGLFAGKGEPIYVYSYKNIILMLNFADLPKGTCLPYLGVLRLQEVQTEDSNTPLRLEPGLEMSWNRIVVLGHQPVVPQPATAMSHSLHFVVLWKIIYLI